MYTAFLGLRYQNLLLIFKLNPKYHFRNSVPHVKLGHFIQSIAFILFLQRQLFHLVMQICGKLQGRLTMRGFVL